MKSAFALCAALATLVPSAALAAEKKYDQGASDTEIRIGQTVPYSGPASYGGTIGRIQSAYFDKLNAEGGINGRKIKLITLDDSYSPPKTVEATRRLVESEGVLATYFSMGTATQAAVQKYLNGKKVPQLMISSGSPKWNEPKKFPWSIAAMALYSTEARVFGEWLLANKPNAKIAVLFQNDDLGRDYLHFLKEALGDKAKAMIVAEASYDITDPTIDSQMVKLANSGADVFYNITVGKFASQSLRKVAELNWKPTQYLVAVSASMTLINAAGPENVKGVRSLLHVKQPASSEWDNDAGIKAYRAFREKYVSNVDPNDGVGLLAYSGAEILVHLIKQAGDNLTRENLLKLASNLNGYEAIHLLPGIKMSLTPTDYEPVRSFYMGEFDGKEWIRSPQMLTEKAAR